MNAPRATTLSLVFVVGLLLMPACADPPAPVGPPRCEPPEEVILERSLKRGFRALAEGHADKARAAFDEVLALEPNHPEAHAGLRALRVGRPLRPEAEAGSQPHRSTGEVFLAGVAVPVNVAVNTERYRVEELRLQKQLAKEEGLPGADKPVPSYYRERRSQTDLPLDPTDMEAMRVRIDLLVLHSSHTQTARHSFLQLGATGGSTHFTIDYEGTVYQNLDLAWEASHSGDAVADARSVAIDMVNPVTLHERPLPEGVDYEVYGRPLSNFVRIHGEEIQEWGYTHAQLSSLYRLSRALIKMLPQLHGRLPGGAEVPQHVLPGRDGFKGVLGHLHLHPRATDPGPGFDWEALAAELR